MTHVNEKNRQKIFENMKIARDERLARELESNKDKNINSNELERIIANTIKEQKEVFDKAQIKSTKELESLQEKLTKCDNDLLTIQLSNIKILGDLAVSSPNKTLKAAAYSEIKDKCTPIDASKDCILGAGVTISNIEGMIEEEVYCCLFEDFTKSIIGLGNDNELWIV